MPNAQCPINFQIQNPESRKRKLIFILSILFIGIYLIIGYWKLVIRHMNHFDCGVFNVVSSGLRASLRVVATFRGVRSSL